MLGGRLFNAAEMKPDQRSDGGDLPLTQIGRQSTLSRTGFRATAGK
jgi:hypothetical protein